MGFPESENDPNCDIPPDLMDDESDEDEPMTYDPRSPDEHLRLQRPQASPSRLRHIQSDTQSAPDENGNPTLPKIINITCRRNRPHAAHPSHRFAPRAAPAEYFVNSSGSDTSTPGGAKSHYFAALPDKPKLPRLLTARSRSPAPGVPASHTNDRATVTPDAHRDLDPVEKLSFPPLTANRSLVAQRFPSNEGRLPVQREESPSARMRNHQSDVGSVTKDTTPALPQLGPRDQQKRQRPYAAHPSHRAARYEALKLMDGNSHRPWSPTTRDVSQRTPYGEEMVEKDPERSATRTHLSMTSDFSENTPPTSPTDRATALCWRIESPNGLLANDAHAIPTTERLQSSEHRLLSHREATPTCLRHDLTDVGVASTTEERITTMSPTLNPPEPTDDEDIETILPVIDLYTAVEDVIGNEACKGHREGATPTLPHLDARSQKSSASVSAASSESYVLAGHQMLPADCLLSDMLNIPAESQVPHLPAIPDRPRNPTPSTPTPAGAAAAGVPASASITERTPPPQPKVGWALQTDDESDKDPQEFPQTETVTRDESRDASRVGHRSRDQHRVLSRRKATPPGLRQREPQNNSSGVTEETTACINPRPPKEKRERSRPSAVKLPPIRGAARAPSAKRPSRLPSARAPSAKHARKNIPESNSPCDDDDVKQQSESDAQIEITKLLYPAMVEPPKIPKPPPKVPKPPQGKPPAVRSRRDMTRPRRGPSPPRGRPPPIVSVHHQKMARRMVESEYELRRQQSELKELEKELEEVWQMNLDDLSFTMPDKPPEGEEEGEGKEE